MALLINPGSGPIAGSVDGSWTNTVEQARREAHKWLRNMHNEGMRDVELLDGEEFEGGRWRFQFRHGVTGVVVELETHGIRTADMAAYCTQHLFEPRIYWHGSSSGTPELDDWAAPGFEPVQTWRPVETTEVA